MPDRDALDDAMNYSVESMRPGIYVGDFIHKLEEAPRVYVTLNAPLDEALDLLATAEEVAEDLKHEVDARHGFCDAEEMSPTDARRRERDLQPANDLLALVDAIREGNPALSR